MKLPIFDKIEGLVEEKKHAKFKFLRDEIQLLSEKDLLSSYTEGMVDKDNKMVRQFQETFHSTYWEIIIYQLCLEAGFSLDQSHNFPDFIIKAPCEFYIEAVVSNIKQAGVPENERTLKDQLSMLIPPHLQENFNAFIDESIIRSLTAISSKIKKYGDYKKASWFNEQSPFVIALSSCDQINYGREYIYSMMAVLYGRYFIPGENACINKQYVKKMETGAELPLGIFLNSDCSEVSAIMYTCTNTIGKLTALALSKGMNTSNQVVDVVRDTMDDEVPFKFRIVSENFTETVSDGIFIFHNPYAKKPINPIIFEKTNVTHIFLQNDKLVSSGLTTPIYTRFSMNSFFLRNMDILQPLITDLGIEFNRLDEEKIDKIVEKILNLNSNIKSDSNT